MDDIVVLVDAMELRLAMLHGLLSISRKLPLSEEMLGRTSVAIKPKTSKK